MRRTPVLIVGGGPAGTAAAIDLARGGLRPELIERSRSPHDVVCGGFLGWDSLRLLRRLGLDARDLGARPITRLRLIAGETIVEAELPHAAAGLSRRSLDAALLALAGRAGARIVRGVNASAADLNARTVQLGDEEVACDALLLATGKRELRGASRAAEPRRREPAVGLRASLPASSRIQRALAGVIELHLFDGGYAGLLGQEDGTANLCLSLSPQRIGAAGGSRNAIHRIMDTEPVLAERVASDLPDRVQAIAGVPYGWGTGDTRPGVFRLGDQAAVIASLAGDGIAIALASGQGAAAALLAGGPRAAQRWQGRFRGQTRGPVAVGEMLRYAAERPSPRKLLLRILALAPSLARSAARLTRIIGPR